MPLKLIVSRVGRNARALKILIAAALSNVNVEVVDYQVESPTPEFLANCHPLGRTPVLETPEGYIFESGAILRYIARQNPSAGLYGQSNYDASCCDMWVDFAAGELDLPIGIKCIIAVAFNQPFSDEEAKCLNDATTEALNGLELWLETRTFLVGERLTIADIAIACSLFWVFPFHPQGEALSKKYRGVLRLYNTVMQQPAVVELMKNFGNVYGAPAKPKEVAKPKEAPKPKEEKKPAKDEDDDEEEVVKEEKKPNPLDSLPPSSFVLDAFKREYSNNDVRTVGAPYLFKNFDPAGFSAFWCKYKYNEDNKKVFMTGNLIRGWFQRMEHVRKYAFGVALIIGEESKHEIVAFWIFRGKGMPQIVLEVEDTELFEWTEIPDLNAVKERVTDYLCWEGPTIPLPVLEGRTFK